MSTEKRSILIVQLGPAEDVYRSLMALKAIKHLYPNVTLSVICKGEMAEPFRRVPFFERVIEIPKVASDVDAVATVASWINEVINQKFDILANWTNHPKTSRMGAIAASLIPAMIKVGDHIRNDMSQGSYDAWSMYREAWLKNEVIDQDIHITDIITTQLLTLLQIHVGDPAEHNSSVSVTSKYFFEPDTNAVPLEWVNRPKGLKWVAIDCASMSERVSEFVEMILRRHPDFGVILLGSADEQFQSNARVLQFLKTPAFSAVVSVFSQCTWLVSGKSALADLASLLNLRVLYSPEVTDRPFSMKWSDSAAYGNGHIVLVSENEWKPEYAYATWSFYQSEWFHKNSLSVKGHFENLGLQAGLKEIQIYKSRIRPANEGGGVCFEKTEGVSLEFEAWMYRVRGQIARAWFCGWLPAIDAEVAKLSLSPELVKKIRALNESLKVMERLASEGRVGSIELAKQSSKTKSGYLMSVEERESIEILGKKINEVETLMLRVIQVEPELLCMVKWYQQLMHNLQGETISEMAKETSHAFDLIAEATELLMAYTKKTLDLAKPKSVSPHAVVIPLPVQN